MLTFAYRAKTILFLIRENYFENYLENNQVIIGKALCYCKTGITFSQETHCVIMRGGLRYHEKTSHYYQKTSYDYKKCIHYNENHVIKRKALLWKKSCYSKCNTLLWEII